MTDTSTCAVCSVEFDRNDGRIAVVEDRHALHNGYNVTLGHDPDAGHLACPGCTDRIGVEGDTFTVVSPRYADDPEAGDVRSVRMVATGPVVSPDYREADPVEHDDPEFELVSAYIRDADLPTDWPRRFEGAPDGADWRQIGTGWHSSMERSEVSERINKITRGDVGIYGPVLVKFGQTRNVCSQSLTVYAPEGLEYWSKEHHERRPFREYLEGEQATPAGAFTA